MNSKELISELRKAAENSANTAYLMTLLNMAADALEEK